MTIKDAFPNTNISYQHNKKTGAVYVYSVKSYWDKEKKAPRNKQVYLGNLRVISSPESRDPIFHIF